MPTIRKSSRRNAERRAAAAERSQKCESYRARMETICLTSRRLYREDANGERVYLGDEERQEARNKDAGTHRGKLRLRSDGAR